MEQLVPHRRVCNFRRKDAHMLGKGPSRIYNLVSVIFLILTVLVVVYVVSQVIQ